MFGDRLQIGRVIESVSDLQGEGQAPAGKCTVSHLHILNGRHNHSNGEVVVRKGRKRERKKKNGAERALGKYGISVLVLIYFYFRYPFKMSSATFRWSCEHYG